MHIRYISDYSVRDMIAANIFPRLIIILLPQVYRELTTAWLSEGALP